MTNRRICIVSAVASGLLMAGFVSAVPALADTPGGFPAIPTAPAWYTSALPAPYATGSGLPLLGDATDQSLWDERVNYYMPTGVAPTNSDSTAAPDIQISNFAVYNLTYGSTPTDPEVVILNVGDAFPQMVQDLGTSLTTGIVIPPAADSPHVNDPAPAVRFLGHGLVEVHRPGLPVDCAGPDPLDYTVDAAMLGENGAKYRVSMDVTFGDRTQLRQEVCAGRGKKVKSQPAPAASVAPSQSASPTPSRITKAKRSAKREIKAAAHVLKPDNSAVVVVLVAALAMLAVIILIASLLKKYRRPKDSYNDGRPIHPDGDDEPEPTRGNASKPHRKSGYGR